MQGDVLGEDRDAAFPFQFVGIENAIADQLVGAEFAALAEQGVDQSRLAVVNVGDNGNVADVVAAHDCGVGCKGELEIRGKGGTFGLTLPR